MDEPRDDAHMPRPAFRLPWRRSSEAEEEIAFHLELRARELESHGMDAAAARAEARRQFGDIEDAVEYCRHMDEGRIREMNRVDHFRELLQDLRYAARVLRRSPVFAAVAILTLALGIGANAAVFSLVRAVLMEPLPYAEPDRLVLFWQRGAESDLTWLSVREVLEYRAATRSFEEIAAYTDIGANLTEGDEPERVMAASVTANIFETLGVPAARGRGFMDADAEPGGEAVVVLGWNLWQRRWGGSADVIGGTIRVNGIERTVVGVMPPDFRLPLDYRQERATELWIPVLSAPIGTLNFGNRSYHIVARLRPGVTHAQADADLDAALRGWCTAGLLTGPCETAASRDPVPLDELIVGSVRPALLLLFGAVGLVLLIACANVANLLFAHADARRKEIATKAALGAGRGRIIRQLLTESGLIAIAGTILGIIIAWAGLRVLLGVTPVNVIRMREVRLDLVVLGFSALLAVATTLLAGLAPALRLSRPALASLAGSRTNSAPMRRSMRRWLVIAETAISVMLVIGAGLLARSFMEIRSTRLGFEPDGVLTMRMELPAADYPEWERVVGFYAQIIDRAETLPGVRSAAAVRNLPLTGTIGDWSITIENRDPAPGEYPNGDWQVVTPGYFETMGVELLAGRTLSDADHAQAMPVVLVNETMAARYWPDGAVGRRFHLGTGDQPWMTIVGVTRDNRHNAVIEEPRAEMFIPHAQFQRQASSVPRGMTLVMRTEGDPLALAAAAREQVRALAPSLPVSDIRAMSEIASNALAPQRFSALLLGVFAGLAMLLASIGLYGVMSYAVARRRHEMGIRIALGATRGSVVRLVLGEGAAVAGMGVVLGVLGALWLTGLIAGQLHGIAARDPLTFALVPIVLVLVALIASYLPARRAGRVDPLAALRD